MPGHFGGSHSGGKKEKTGGSTNRERGADRNRSQTLSPGVKARNKAAMEKAAKDRDRDKLSNYEVGKVPGFGPVSFILNAGQTLRQKSFEYNRKFFREKVLTSKNRGNFEDTFTSYSNYIKGRGAGTIDAYGNPIGGRDNDNNRTILSQEPAAGVVTSDGIVGPIIGSNAVKSPAEIQAEKNKEGGIILAKKIGRSRMIKTSAQGLTDDEDIITRKQLLG